MMSLFRHIAAAVLLTCVSLLSVHAQGKGYAHEVSAGMRSSYILPTNGYFTGFNPLGVRIEQSSSAHLEYTFRLPADSSIGRLYHSYQGIGVGMHSFGTHEHIGTPLSLYAVQGASLASIGSWATFDYRWNLGLSYGWNNHESKLTATEANIYLGIGLFMSVYAGRHFKFSVGPEYAHYSNGDTKFPNCGTNTIGLRASLSGRFGNEDKAPSPDRLFRKEAEDGHFAKGMTYDMILQGSWRADRITSGHQIYYINDKFLVCGLSFNPLYHFNRYIGLGPSLDLIYDRSANLITYIEDREFKGFAYPQWWKQTAAGLSLKTELRMAFISINAGLGYSFCVKDSDLSGIYSIFGMKLFLADHMYLNLGYRLNSKVYTHSLSFGLGWRFGSL